MLNFAHIVYDTETKRWCITCLDIAFNHHGFGPHHNAKQNCESGKYDHCSCDTCF